LLELLFELGFEEVVVEVEVVAGFVSSSGVSDSSEDREGSYLMACTN
jgi:hypothetical protein